MPLDTKLPTGWSLLAGEEGLSFDEELRRELPEGHVLKGLFARAFARRERRDDFLFELENGSIALVHLTWAIEQDPKWPAAEVFEDLAACKYAIEHDDD